MNFAEVLQILKEYGPGAAGWALFIALFGWMAGQGGKLAIANVRSLLAESEEMRKRAMKSNADFQDLLDEKDEVIRELQGIVETARQTMAQMHDDMLRLKRDHSRDMLLAQEEAHRLRLELSTIRERKRR